MPEVVVITGASAGVGRATAREFARRGAHIGLLARNEDGLRGAREDVQSLGGKVLEIPTDVADPEQIEVVAQKVEEEFGPIDVWVNDAMATVFSEFKDITPEEFKRATEVTYLGAVYGTMSALKRMLPRDRVRWSRSARRSPTVGSRCNRPTAGRSTPCGALPTPSGPS